MANGKSGNSGDGAVGSGGTVLTASHRRLLAEAIQRGEAARREVETTMIDYGRWLFLSIFGESGASALERPERNPVWAALLEHAGGPKLRLDRKMLSILLRTAAYDKTITDEAWRNLEPARKAIILPLDDADLMREAAQHVTAMKLSFDATREYVKAVRKENDDAPIPRETPARLASRTHAVRERLVSAPRQRVILDAVDHMDAATRRAFRRDLDALAGWIETMRERLG